MRLILSRILWNFDLELAEPNDDWTNQKIFVIWQKKPLNVKVTLRKNWNVGWSFDLEYPAHGSPWRTSWVRFFKFDEYTLMLISAILSNIVFIFYIDISIFQIFWNNYTTLFLILFSAGCSLGHSFIYPFGFDVCLHFSVLAANSDNSLHKSRIVNPDLEI